MQCLVCGQTTCFFSSKGAAKHVTYPQFLSSNSSQFLTNHKSYKQTKFTVTEEIVDNEHQAT